MSMKRPSLFGSKAAAVETLQPQPNRPAELQAKIVAGLDVAPAQDTTGRRYPVASTRQGKRVTGVYLSDEALAQLKMIAVRERKTVQAVMVEAVNQLFESRGLSRIAD